MISIKLHFKYTPPREEHKTLFSVFTTFCYPNLSRWFPRYNSYYHHVFSVGLVTVQPDKSYTVSVEKGWFYFLLTE
jgi:hypothetical protein